jgi:hypothetical protein
VRKLLLVAMLVSCEGRCDTGDAVTDVVGGADCVADRTRAICIKGQVLVTCGVTGAWSSVAHCTTLGTINFNAGEAP